MSGKSCSHLHEAVTVDDVRVLRNRFYHIGGVDERRCLQNLHLVQHQEGYGNSEQHLGPFVEQRVPNS